MSLGLGSSLSKSGIVTPGIVTDNLVLKHMYGAGEVVPVSDGAAYFGGAGADDYIDCGAVNLGTSGCSYGGWFWINSTQTDQFATLIGQADWDSVEPQHIEGTILRLNNNHLQMSFGDDTNGVNDTGQIDDFLTTAGNTNTWKHIYVTLSSGTTGSLTSKLYVDGVLQVTDTNVHFEPNHSTVNLTIGKALLLNASQAALSGYASNVSVYTAELTQAQIKSIMWKNYAGLTDSEKTNLVSWWNLDSTIESTAQLGNTVVYDNHDTTLGDNIVANSTFSGGVESPWVDSGTGFPGADEDAAPSTEQAYIGTHSMKIIGGASGDGTSTVFSEPTVVGKLYRFEVWFYVISGVAKINPGDTPFGAYTPPTDEEAVTTTTNQWEKVVTYAWCDSVSTSESLFISCHGGASTFYIDNIKVQIVQGNPGELK